MAKYYYDRYGVDSSTTYTWSKYNTVSTTTYTWDKYSANDNYYLSSWGSKVLVGSDIVKYFGLGGYLVLKSTSYIQPVGHGRSIYRMDMAGLSDVVYEISSDGQTIYRYHFSEDVEGDLYRQTANLLHKYVRGTYISQTSGRSYSYKTNNARNSDGYWWVRGSSSTTYSRGTYISQTSGQSYGYKLNDQRNSDGYWWVRGSSSTAYSRGSYVDTIIAEDGTYPTDGRVGTSYWYVRGSILTHTVTFKDWDGTTLKTQTVNDGSSASPPTDPSRTGYTFDGWSGSYSNVTSNITITATYSYIPVPPSTPSSITVPTDVKGGYDLYISWGSSTGASKYYLYRNIDSGGYVSIYSGTSRNYTDTIPKGASTVSYRVRAYNSDGYSSYRTSSTRSVRNFPEMKFKIDGSITTSESGWVKVNGVLRPIEQIWVKVNDSLKEVQ